MKIIRTLFALLLAVFALTVAALVFVVKFTPDTTFGAHLKNLIVVNPKLVSLININQPGDMRFYYLKPGGDIVVNVYHSEKILPDNETKGWIEEMIKVTVEKGTVVNIIKDDTIANLQLYMDDDLNVLRSSLIKGSPRADLNIIYLTSYSQDPGYVGITLHRDTIFIFKETMMDLTKEPRVLKLIENSTLMHEWGHLLGLEHVDDVNCIMSEAVEVYENRRFQETNIPTTYCPDELFKLKVMRGEFE